MGFDISIRINQRVFRRFCASHIENSTTQKRPVFSQMKNALLIFLLLPLSSSAQKFYLQAGAGYVFPDYPGNSGVVADLNGGWNITSTFRMGIGGSYTKGKLWVGNAYIPLYADFKYLWPCKLRPYIFIQPGYGLYKSEPIYDMASNPNKIIYMHGGFTSNQGIGLLYQYVYLQISYRMENITYKPPGFSTIVYHDYYLEISAGGSIP
jgi:hypothetical protein